ncbi:DNA replication/repair protein RecF [Saxibacter everestensis]|uniref:DNA replication and repair protein RecF n=1 Tax=Saxibacter everestensis TaxID=2909229 RepID=A0ABY8QRZ8_9MICO|nr:DNA replication/repair protein RecF [Brevibacteriaceae bacterium ZFBP1038]
MYVSQLALGDFRSYSAVDLKLAPGTTIFVGANGLGKTNLVEAIGYLATLGSHRVSSDVPLVRAEQEAAIIRAQVFRGERTAVLEVQINVKGSNKARINRNVVKPRELLGMLTTVLFAPEDLALVKGDPGERRRFLDDLLVARSPRFAAVRSDYERVLKQRNALLKSARIGGSSESKSATLDVWDHHLSQAGAQLLAGRLRLVDELRPHVASAYAHVSGESAPQRRLTDIRYRKSTESGPADQAGSNPGDPPAEATQTAEYLAVELAEAYRLGRQQEIDRGNSLFGPHRDDLELQLGNIPAKGYASHGESWSYALALRLASFELHKADAFGKENWPVLILDDVFAELDVHRRARLAGMVATAEQVLITAAVEDDIPAVLAGERVQVQYGAVGP